MALTAPTNQIGTTVSISAATPATEDAAGYGALTFTEIGGVVSVPELGDAAEDSTVTTLKDGRVMHFNGAKDMGAIVIPYVYDAADAGQVIVRANANGTTECSLLITDADGTEHYLIGVIGPVMQSERVPGTHKGETFEFRTISGEVTA